MRLGVCPFGSNAAKGQLLCLSRRGKSKSHRLQDREGSSLISGPVHALLSLIFDLTPGIETDLFILIYLLQPMYRFTERLSRPLSCYYCHRPFSQLHDRVKELEVLATLKVFTCTGIHCSPCLGITAINGMNVPSASVTVLK